MFRTFFSSSSCRDSPTRLDRDVLAAVQGAEIDPLKFPSIHKWKSTVQSYSSTEMQRCVYTHTPFAVYSSVTDVLF